MSEMAIEVEKRAITGKGKNRQLRASGKLPAVVYGAGKETVAIQVDRRQMLDLIQAGGENTIYLLRMGGTGQERHAMIRELQIDHLSRKVLHIDFQRIQMDRKIKVQVPIEIVGVPYGVKTDGGILDFVNRHVEVECLPSRIPPSLKLEVSELHIGQHLEAKALELPEGVVLIDDPERVLVSVAHAKAEAAPEPVAEELIEAEKQEPEVIKKGKPTEEE